jgi:hypothetical protein
VGLVARVADSVDALRKALDDANFTGTPVREAGNGAYLQSLDCCCQGPIICSAMSEQLGT